MSPDSIARFERREALYPRAIAAIRTAFEAGGVEVSWPPLPKMRYYGVRRVSERS